MSEAAEVNASPGAAGHDSQHRVPCAACGGPVDPLRAARVALFGERFHYFCTAACRDRYVPHGAPAPATRRNRLEVTEGSNIVVATRESERENVAHRHDTARALAAVADDALDTLASGAAATADAPPPATSERQNALDGLVGPTDIGTILLATALVGVTLTLALILAGDSPTILTARVILVVASCGSLAAYALTTPRDPTELHPAILLGGPLSISAAAAAARFLEHPETASSINVAALVVLGSAACSWLAERARQPIDAERERIARELAVPGYRIVGEEVSEAANHELRPGEEIVVGPGDVVPVDATVTAGRAEVRPWLEARCTASRAEGDPIVAGARVLSGRLRAIAGWAGTDRAWVRLTVDPRRRADVTAPLARFGRHVAERGAPVAAAIAALAAYSSERSGLVIVGFAAAAHVALANASVASVAALHIGRGVLAALQRGVAFRTAEALDRAGRVSTAAFCARGTLLLGEPQVANVEPIGRRDPEDVLALVAGAESGASHPAAVAILRAARARGVRPDAVRSPTVLPGLGVTAIASNGEPLVVGSRALMLRERVSVAVAEAKVTDLEAMGRTVVLVALSHRLVGVIGLQDGLRPGARAAVQHLLDAGVEPVLLSGDARETCEALGRAVDIEHIRPEVLPADRGAEIRRLAEGGAIVAAFGRSPTDDMALGAADVSVALAAAGSSATEWNVQLASDDIRDAAYAIRIAHRCRREAHLGLVLAAAPGLAGTLSMAIGLAGPAVAPVAAALGAGMALYRLRSPS